jgi:hypothetical protein
MVGSFERLYSTSTFSALLLLWASGSGCGASAQIKSVMAVVTSAAAWTG